MDKTITILGSTGSIGTQTLNVAEKHGIKINSLSANNNIVLLENQARKFNPAVVCISEKNFTDLKLRLADTNIKITTDILEISSQKVDLLVNALVGMSGLLPTVAAIENGNDIALANKETLVTGGGLIMRKAREKNIKILPIDSEHSAIWQCLQGNKNSQVKKILLTASGGAFFGRKNLENITLQDALKHPNWDMGAKVTIDSSTLMNKGLEFIEAMRLFDLTPDQIEVIVHPQSIVHSAVEFLDNSIIAQMGVPDMQIPIQYALLYPDHLPSPAKSLSLTDIGTLAFYKPDFETFTCLRSCITAAKMGEKYTCAVNAANDIAIELFINGNIKYNEIFEYVEKALSLNLDNGDINTIDEIYEITNKVKNEQKDNNISA